MKLDAFILAGGKSSRMGSDKGLIDVNGSPMVQHAINLLSDLGCDIKIISNNNEYEQFEYPTIPDIVIDKGPLGGIYTALKNSNSEKIIVLSCDTPFVSKEVLKRLITECENNDVTVASFEGRIHPLIGVYSLSLSKEIKERLDRGELKIMSFVETVSHEIIEFNTNDQGVDSSTFLNINTREELEEIRS